MAELIPSNSTYCEHTYVKDECTKCCEERPWEADFRLHSQDMKILGWQSEGQMVVAAIGRSGGKNYINGAPRTMMLREFWELHENGSLEVFLEN